MPVRPRRRADRHGQRAHEGVAADVRRLPRRAGAAAVRPGGRLPDVRRRQAARGRRARLPRQPRHHAARGRPRRRPDERDGRRARQPQERACSSRCCTATASRCSRARAGTSPRRATPGCRWRSSRRPPTRRTCSR
nr:hypothetical protein [Angustibacter aerolatus]